MITCIIITLRMYTLPDVEMTNSHKALVAPTVFCEVTLKVYVYPASRLGRVILIVSTLLIETGTGLLIMNSSSNV